MSELYNGRIILVGVMAKNLQEVKEAIKQGSVRVMSSVYSEILLNMAIDGKTMYDLIHTGYGTLLTFR